MTLTSPSCPAAQSLPREVAEKVKGVPGVTAVKVDVVWDPAVEPDDDVGSGTLELGMWRCYVSERCAINMITEEEQHMSETDASRTPVVSEEITLTRKGGGAGRASQSGEQYSRGARPPLGVKGGGCSGSLLRARLRREAERERQGLHRARGSRCSSIRRACSILSAPCWISATA